MLKKDPQYVNDVLTLLKKHHPNAKIILNFSNNWELLVAVMLSAQSTDKTVNTVTEKLFKKYKTIKDYADVNVSQLEKDIYSSGFYRNKAKNIKRGAQIIMERYGGKVPKTMVDLISLPGVARKTANIVLGNAFNVVDGIAVDTHVYRLSRRLGWSESNNTDKVEKDLMKIIPKEDWLRVTYLLIEHGRAICNAPLPKCDQCFLNKICPSAFQFPNFQQD